MIKDEQFVSRKALKKYKTNSSDDIVQSSEKFSEDIHGTEISISGGEIILFAKSIEKKYREYVGNSFVEFLPDGILSKKNKSFSGYKLGTAICKHYGLDIRRFIEAQYYYHDSWKSSEPSLSYITSLHSEWNSVGRYKSYCDKFRDSIDYFGEEQDNVNPAFKSKATNKNNELKPEVLLHYEQMIHFQMESSGKSKKEVLTALAHPERSYLPMRYLSTVPEYLQLLAEGVWGSAVDNNPEAKRLKLEIEFGNRC